ncbi:MAG: hypothetical protein HRU34_08130 [Richelia sp.]|nr:hypothetical protein [Richelia sp.]
MPIGKLGVAESGDDLNKFSTIYQCFQTLIHPALMQCWKLFITNNKKVFLFMLPCVVRDKC